MGLADEPNDKGTVYLVDEAHNLVERMREMYSAELTISDLKGLERLLRTTSAFKQVGQAVHAALASFPAWDKTLPAGSSGGQGRRPSYQVVHTSDAFEDSLAVLADGIGTALEQHFPSTSGWDEHNRQTTAPNDAAIELFLALRDTSLIVRAFLGALQRREGGYVTFLDRAKNGGRRLKIYCVNPSHDLSERLEQAKAAVFFSGTLLPMDYHRKLLAAQDDDATLDVQSSFDYRHQQVLIGSDISARFSQRGPQLYIHIATYLVALTQARPGNYLVFLPSYAMMEEVAKSLIPLVDSRTVVVRQRPGLREDEREDYVARFRESHTAGSSLIGLCVLGGIFGESIDLPGKTLVGVVVVGTGMPRSSSEREIIRDYFDAREGKGFVYAYTYPGLSKVLQAAGRLIRTEEDSGVVLLLDDRFLESDLRKAFPKEWKSVQTCTLKTMPKLLAHDQDT